MNYKRAVGIGALIYFVTMVIGIIVCSALGLAPDVNQPIPNEMWIASALCGAILSIAGAYWYFQGKSLRPNLRAGVKFGAAVIMIGFLLDLLFFATLAWSDSNPLTAITSYYGQLPFWGTLVLILAGSGFTGWWLDRKR